MAGVLRDTPDSVGARDPVSVKQATRTPRERPRGSAILLQSGGYGALLAGVLFVTWGYVHRNDAPWYFDDVATALSFVVPALFLAGSVGLFALCKGLVDLIGKLGLILCIAGSAMGLAY